MKNKPVKTDYRWRKRRILLFFVAILVIFLIPAVVLSIYVFRHVGYLGVESVTYQLQDVYRPEKFKVTDIKHEIHTSDGETLWCAEVRAEKPQGVIIYLSGIKQPSVTYFYPHAAWMKKNDFSSFLLEVRAHGNSTGRKLGLGYTEVEDVRATVEYIKSMKLYQNVPIIVQGVDLGGTIAINAAGQIPEVDACIAMSPFAAADTQMDLVLKKYFVPGFLRAVEKPILHQTLRLLYGKDTADNINPEVQIQIAADKPVLVIASLRDPVVPVENSLILRRLSSEAEVWIRDSEDHYVIWNNDFEHMESDVEYCVYLNAFFNKVLKRYEK